MIWDLASVKDFLNVTGTADDAKVQGAMNVALAWAEKYCRRQFMYARETTKYFDTHYVTLPVPRYPIAVVHSLTGTDVSYHVHQSAGILKFDGYAAAHEITVDYEGGFNPLPDDLVLALMQIAQSIYSGMTGGAPAATGAVKSISSDGARIEYDVSGGSVAGVDSDTGMPSMAINILDMYRREMA